MNATMSTKRTDPAKSRPVPLRPAEVVREYGPFDGATAVHGVSHDGRNVWAAVGTRLIAIEPDSGAVTRSLARSADAGTAFDGTHLYQIARASTRSTPRPAPSSRRSPPPATATTRVSRGPRTAYGSGNTATGRSIRSIRRPAPCCARSSRIASSRA